MMMPPIGTYANTNKSNTPGKAIITKARLVRRCGLRRSRRRWRVRLAGVADRSATPAEVSKAMRQMLLIKLVIHALQDRTQNGDTPWCKAQFLIERCLTQQVMLWCRECNNLLVRAMVEHKG